MVRKMNKRVAKHSTKSITKKRKVLEESVHLSMAGKVLGMIGCIVLVIVLVWVIRNTIFRERCDISAVPESNISRRVIMNSDKGGRKIPVCGVVRLSEACLYYVLNGCTYDYIAEDFFEEVAQKTQRSIYQIRVDNPSYAKVLIPPGRFAEIIVPAK